MQLLDRYLKAVRVWLPRAQQDDIIKELSDHILSQVEDREEELGRPLTLEEESAILKQHGHPLLVASRYRHAPVQQLIGPVLFPLYWFVLRILMWIGIAVYAVNGLFLLLSGHPVDQIVHAFLNFPAVVIPVFGWVTLAFAVADFFQARSHFMDRWDPASLPAMPDGMMNHAERASRRARHSYQKRERWDRHGYRRPRHHPIGELIGGLIVIAWWLVIPRYPFLIFGPAAGYVGVSAGWMSVYQSIAWLLLIPIGVHLLSAFSMSNMRLRSIARIISRGVSLAVINLLMKAGTLVVIAGPVGDPANHSEVVTMVNSAIFWTLIVASVVTVVKLLVEIVQLIRRWNDVGEEASLGADSEAPVS